MEEVLVEEPAVNVADAPKPSPKAPDGTPKMITNSIEMRLVLIPAGTSNMGSPGSDPIAERQEESQNRIRSTQPFYLGVTEVTRGQFDQFVVAARYRTEAEKDGKGAFGWNEKTRWFEQNPRYTWLNPGFAQTDQHPVVNVSRNDALAFARWLSEKEGKSYRLPTETEWEYACRAGTTTRFSTGDNPEALAAVGNVADGTARKKYPNWNHAISARDGYVYTAPVGRFRPNPFGLYDMHGNVWEWCFDSAAPPEIIRGGSWFLVPDTVGSANRLYFDAGSRYSHIGFRVALVPSAPSAENVPEAAKINGGELPRPLAESGAESPARAQPDNQQVPPAGHPRLPADPAGPPKEIRNAIGMKLVLIPAGEFLMGSSKDEDKDAAGDEMVDGTKHRVRITRPFYLGLTEVTQGQYLAVSGRNPSHFKGSNDLPVDQVHWNDAVDFCNTLSSAEGLPLFYKVEGFTVEVSDWKGPGYRLPTEAEWEYACRARTTTRYHSGDDPETLATVANVADATARARFPDWTMSIEARDNYVFSAPAGRFRPNGFGLFDMHGNVWEWCWDWYKDDYYKESPVDDPTGPSTGADRVKRGGSWFLKPLYARSAKRDKDAPVGGMNFLGFRIARGQSGSKPAHPSSTHSGTNGKRGT